MLPALIPIGSRTLGEVLSMPESFALPLLEPCKGDAITMQAAYDYEAANKCRYTTLVQLHTWINAAHRSSSSR